MVTDTSKMYLAYALIVAYLSCQKAFLPVWFAKFPTPKFSCVQYSVIVVLGYIARYGIIQYNRTLLCE